MLTVPILLFAIVWGGVAQVIVEAQPNDAFGQYLLGSIGSVALGWTGMYLGLWIEGDLGDRQWRRHTDENHWHLLDQEFEANERIHFCDSFLMHLHCGAVLSWAGLTFGSVAIVAEMRDSNGETNNFVAGLIGASVGSVAAGALAQRIGLGFLLVFPLLIFTFPTVGAMFGLSWPVPSGSEDSMQGGGTIELPLFKFSF
jgi:uncharacterized membrane protein YeaQ/YmgE (transglycosylase-associated protein family)